MPKPCNPAVSLATRQNWPFCYTPVHDDRDLPSAAPSRDLQHVRAEVDVGRESPVGGAGTLGRQGPRSILHLRTRGIRTMPVRRPGGCRYGATTRRVRCLNKRIAGQWHSTFFVPCWDFRSTHSPTSARSATTDGPLVRPAAQPGPAAPEHAIPEPPALATRAGGEDPL